MEAGDGADFILSTVSINLAKDLRLITKKGNVLHSTKINPILNRGYFKSRK
jgi:hypothetical protein